MARITAARAGVNHIFRTVPEAAAQVAAFACCDGGAPGPVEIIGKNPYANVFCIGWHPYAGRYDGWTADMPIGGVAEDNGRA